MSRPEAERQLQRVLAMIPWLVAHPDTPKDDLAARFGVSRAQLDADLGLMMMVGVPPYTPGDYVEVDDDGETVRVALASYFTRPLRLSPAEGLALLAAGRTLLAVPGSDPDGPLARALRRLEETLGDTPISVEVDAPPHLDALRDAAARAERVEIDYWSAGRDAHTTRRIDPGPPFFGLGAWYTDAYCHLRQAPRMFRVDRVHAVRPTGEHFDPGRAAAPDAVYHPRPEDVRVTLDLAPEAAWVPESHPVESVEDLPDGGQRVVLAVTEPAWLARLLVRLGQSARVVEPREWADLGTRAARAALARYGAGH